MNEVVEKLLLDYATGKIFRITRQIFEYDLNTMGKFSGYSKAALSLMEQQQRAISEKTIEKFLITFNVSKKDFEKARDEIAKLSAAEPIDKLEIHHTVVKMLLTAKE